MAVTTQTGPSKRPWLQDCWYVAAAGDDVGEGLLRRVILDEPVVLFRDESGAVALRDSCPHRFAPLSMGKRVEAGIECPYHGLVFARTGACVHNPNGNGQIAPGAGVKSFPLVERYGYLWIWMGSSEKADPELLPDFRYLEAEDSSTRLAGYMSLAANYEIITDNLLDLTHVDYIHPFLSSFGGTTKSIPKVTEDDRTVVIKWSWGPSAPMPTFPQGSVPEEVHSHFKVTLQMPSCIRVDVVSAEASDLLDDPSSPRLSAVHLLTPETEFTTHYFYGGVRNVGIGDEEYSRILEAGGEAAFREEDRPIIEAVQQNMGAHTDIIAAEALFLSSDLGSFRARTKLRKMIDAES